MEYGVRSTVWLNKVNHELNPNWINYRVNWIKKLYFSDVSVSVSVSVLGGCTSVLRAPYSVPAWDRQVLVVWTPHTSGPFWYKRPLRLVWHITLWEWMEVMWRGFFKLFLCPVLDCVGEYDNMIRSICVQVLVIFACYTTVRGDPPS